MDHLKMGHLGREAGRRRTINFQIRLTEEEAGAIYGAAERYGYGSAPVWARYVMAIAAKRRSSTPTER